MVIVFWYPYITIRSRITIVQVKKTYFPRNTVDSHWKLTNEITLHFAITRECFLKQKKKI